jgi:hypothetical protein
MTIGAGNSLPQTFDEIHIWLRNVRYSNTGSGHISIYFNNDTTLNNYWHQMQRTFSTTNEGIKQNNANVMRLGGSNTLLQANGEIIIPGYTNASDGKIAQGYYTLPGLTAFPNTGNLIVGRRSVGWSGTAPITEIDLTIDVGSWASGRILTYGLSYSRP